MKRNFYSLFFLLNISVFCYSENNFSISFYENKEYENISDVNILNYKVQELAYIYYFNEKNFDGIKDFYDYIQSLKDTVWYSIDFCNPVIIAILSTEYCKYLAQLYDKIPYAFQKSSKDSEGFSDKPIIYAVRYGGIDSVKFFFDKKIEIKLDESVLFSWWDAGGSRYPYGFNLMTVADGLDKYYNKEMIDYLATIGYEKEEIAPNVDYYIAESKNVFVEPGLENRCVDFITPKQKIKVEKFTMYKQNGYQWAKITYGKNKEGWITVTNIRHDVRGGGI